MSGRKKDEERREPRRSKQEDRKESAQKRGKPSTSELDSLNKLITDQSGQSTTDSRRKRTESSSDSDAKVSRFKTPAKRVRRKIETPTAPKKGKETDDKNDVTDESGDEGHRRSKKMLESDTELERELKKEISNLKRRLKGSLKSQTIKISLDLDKKNKDLI